MAQVRITHPIPADLNHDCDSMHIENYELEEVMLPLERREAPRKAIRIVIRGRNFRAVAQPLTAVVGRTPVHYIRIAPDERSLEGLLLSEPEPGSFVDVMLGDQDSARHPVPVELARIRRIVPQ